MTKPVLAKEDEYGRQYIHPVTGETVPSVTSIIKHGVPKPMLVNWAARMAAQHACANWGRLSIMPHAERMDEIKTAHQVYTEKKASIGDSVHDLVDCWSSGRPFPGIPKEINSYVDRFIDFLTEIRPKFLENETTFWSRAHGYAGTGDFIIDVNGRVLLADLKTGRNLYPEVGLQTSALAHADFMLRPNGEEVSLPRIDGIAALHVRPRSWKLVELHHSEECFEAFLHAKGVMNWDKEVSGYVLD